jgi:hypothetical protein
MITRSFVGIRNVVDSRDIPDNALTNAVDVDVNDAGVILACPGYVKSSDVAIDDIYQTYEGRVYAMSNGNIDLVNDDLSLLNLATSTATEFCDFNRQLFTNDGLHIQGSNVGSLVVPAPDEYPQILLNGSGIFVLPGKYAAVYTYVNESGLEGVISPPATVIIPYEMNVGVSFPAHPLAPKGNAYLTHTNGGVFYNIDTGVELHPANKSATDSFPNADKIEYFDSRLYCSEPYGDYTAIWYSQRGYYHLFDKGNDHFIIPGKVEAMKATQSALIIATSSEIYASDGLSLTKLADYGVPKGRSMVKEPMGDTLLIHTKRGVCRAMPFQNLTEKKCQLPTGSVCSTAIVNDNGFQKFIALRDGDSSIFNPY